MKSNKIRTIKKLIRSVNVIALDPYVNHRNIAEQLIQIDSLIYCQQCLKNLIEIESTQLKQIQQKFIYYKQYQAELGKHETIIKKSYVQQPDESVLLIQMKEVNSAIQKLQQQQNQIKKRALELKKKTQLQNEEENNFWECLLKIQKKLYNLEEKSNSIKYQMIQNLQQLQKLKTYNVITEVFKIRFDGEVSYINDLAIGKKQKYKKQIDWQETNAGLGHLFLLFCFFITKYQYTCMRFIDIDCTGSLSKVKIANKRYSIAYTQETEKQFGFFLDEFLIQLQLLRVHIEIVSQKQIKIQYPNKININQNKINNQFINPTRIKSSKWDVWTVSMKYLLTNFQYICSIFSLSDKYA